MSIRSIALALAAAATLAVPAVASAATKETTTTGVHYKDLDLASAGGQKELERRIDKAARSVCGMDENVVGSRISARDSRECYRTARQQLGEQVSRLVKDSAAG